ncbi:11236_t:CDS:2, partial [Acaulospora colombiana]
PTWSFTVRNSPSITEHSVTSSKGSVSISPDPLWDMIIFLTSALLFSSALVARFVRITAAPATSSNKKFFITPDLRRVSSGEEMMIFLYLRVKDDPPPTPRLLVELAELPAVIPKDCDAIRGEDGTVELSFDKWSGRNISFTSTISSLSPKTFKMVLSSVLGFPRIGANREVKKAVEAYWGGKISADDLQRTAAETRKTNWTTIKDQGVDIIPSGEFTLYDHVLDHSTAFNAIPPRYQGLDLSDLDVFFAMGRGRQADGVDVPAAEMKKWFDSNYHYVVPELSDNTEFKLNYNKALNEYKEAKACGITTRPVVLGPLAFLILGKAGRDASPDFKPISLLPKLLPIYKKLLSELKAEGVEWVQLDEPNLVMDVAE